MKVELIDMEFFAHHGCSQEERLRGNRFLVSVSVEPAGNLCITTDKLEDGINYASVYLIVKREMNVSSALLEHLAGRILKAIWDQWPGALLHARVTVSKQHPPIPLSRIAWSRVTLTEADLPEQTSQNV